MTNLNFAGWQDVLWLFLPITPLQLLFDLLLFLVLPAALVLLSLYVARKRFVPGALGAWRTAGKWFCGLMWFNLFFLLLFALLALVLTGNDSLLTPAEKAYRAQFANEAIVAETPISEQIASYAVEHRIVADSLSDGRGIVAFCYDNYGFLHYLACFCVDAALIVWLFFPGIAMKNQRTKF